jgi:predicted hydrolase (HD superfamily)
MQRGDVEISRDAAWQLLTEWTTGESLRKHALAVEAAVRGYARTFGEDEEAWGVVALLHDMADRIAPHSHGQVAADILGPYVSERNRWVVETHPVFQGYYYYHHGMPI